MRSQLSAGNTCCGHGTRGRQGRALLCVMLQTCRLTASHFRVYHCSECRPRAITERCEYHFLYYQVNSSGCTDGLHRNIFQSLHSHTKVFRALCLSMIHRRARLMWNFKPGPLVHLLGCSRGLPPLQDSKPIDFARILKGILSAGIQAQSDISKWRG